MYSDSGSPSHKDRAFYDLVNLCSTIMTGCEDPFFNTYGELSNARQDFCGEWVELMGGVLRIKAFKRGTLHVEVHPEIANRLNIALAYIYPNELPDEATLKKPRRKSGFGSMPIIRSKVPQQVRSYLALCRQKKLDNGLWQVVAAAYTVKIDGIVRRLITEVMHQIGGYEHGNEYLFDFPPMEVISKIVATGEVPDKISHQFYPTPNDLANEFVEWLELNDSMSCYESSAGTGALARQMPLQTHCIEIDALRCMTLDKQGFEVTKGDFLRLSPSDMHGPVDAVVMNPPFAGRAWQDHVEHAVQYVKEGGLIGAILPMGAISKMPELAGTKVTYSEIKVGRFPGTSIEVVFAKWFKPKQSQRGQTEAANSQELGSKRNGDGLAA